MRILKICVKMNISSSVGYSGDIYELVSTLNSQQGSDDTKK